MPKEYATLRRRPFLTPVWLSVLAAAGVLLAAGWALRAASTTVVVVVPASRSADMPDLVVAALGETRAALLGAVLGVDGAPDTRPQALVTTQAVTATSLAQPLARRLGLTLSTVAAGAPDRLAWTLLAQHRGERVIAVAEQAEVEALVHTLAGSQTLNVPAHAVVVVAIPRFSRPAVLSLSMP